MARTVILQADGGSRGNPGIAGSGSVIFAEDHETVLRELSYVFGEKVTNNVAEYQGLVNGLNAARELGATTVRVFLDSKLVVEQMTGRWRIKHADMKRLATIAKKLGEEIGEVTYKWVPRAKNARADELANRAMDAAAAGHPEGFLDDGNADDGGNDEPGDAAPEGAPAPAPAGGGGDEKGSGDGNGPERWSAPGGGQLRLVLVRHGQTRLSAEGCFSGLGDPELTELGAAQAARAAADVAAIPELDAAAVLTSPLSRARQTAEPVARALGLEPVVEDRLIELDFGDFEALTAAEAEARDPEAFRAWHDDLALPAPGGESLEELYRRVAALKDDLLERHEGKTLVVVSHMAPIKSLILQALGLPVGAMSRIFLDLGAVTTLRFGPGTDDGLVRTVNSAGPPRL
ncbi:bifunctional RNase H/acid phosphatase [Corynebacterium otitidis]|uniref:bifunctional RNase H/acid phosphatase n=1 Tax=Corynebacterium otitidis TaxID=29321 RepID=UPI0006277564|nr:bifunctional RNase H/acid phosphatase [Corynebacterium otitidis]KKO83565.1 hypothetical protein AAV33_05865 [Corynebacterium otitidis]